VLDGTDHVTVACAQSAFALVISGASGTDDGVADFELLAAL
jgi:hypothetical protein